MIELTNKAFKELLLIHVFKGNYKHNRERNRRYKTNEHSEGESTVFEIEIDRLNNR